MGNGSETCKSLPSAKGTNDATNLIVASNTRDLIIEIAMVLTSHSRSSIRTASHC